MKYAIKKKFLALFCLLHLLIHLSLRFLHSHNFYVTFLLSLYLSLKASFPLRGALNQDLIIASTRERNRFLAVFFQVCCMRVWGCYKTTLL